MGRLVDTGIIRRWFTQHRPRGAAVPFETLALCMARVCEDERDGLIAILRDFANNGTAYIVPWKSLPLMATMTEHDMALHEAIVESKATTPALVRTVISKLALSGALGPESKAREGERTRADQSRLADVELVLILHLLNSAGADLATLMGDPARWRDTDAKSAVAAAATAVGVKRQDIYPRIGEFSRLLAPVGLVAAQGTIQSGWLRTLHSEIDVFGQSVATRSRSESPDVSAHLTAIAEAARRTADLSSVVFGMLDYAVLDIGGTIRRWNTELPVLSQAIERLSQMLDEWPSLMKLVREALRSPPDDVLAKLRSIRSMLPHTPDAADGVAGSPSVSDALGAKLSPIWSMLCASRSQSKGTVTA
jgi:hypothetical protein